MTNLKTKGNPMTTTIDALVEALEKISTGDAWHKDGVIGFAKEALDRARAEQADQVAEPTLLGRWHHGNGALCSGTIRIAQADFDTQPPREFQSRVFDEICETMNARVAAYEAKRYATTPSPAPAKREPSPTAGMNIAQRILHVGGRNNAAGYVEFGSIQAVGALVRQVLRDLPAPSKPQILTDAECDAIYAALHRWAQKMDPYRWGLPLPCDDGFDEGGGVIRRAIEAAHNAKLGGA